MSSSYYSGIWKYVALEDKNLYKGKGFLFACLFAFFFFPVAGFIANLTMFLTNWVIMWGKNKKHQTILEVKQMIG